MKGVEIYKLDVKRDHRGWLVEVLRADHLGDNRSFGQFYLTTAYPGQVKANHYHKLKTEWFCVIKGNGLFVAQDIQTGKREELSIGEKNMITVEVKPEMSHGIKNIDEEMLYLLIYSNRVFDPEDPDTFYHEVIK